MYLKKKNNLLLVSIAKHFEVRNPPQHGYNLRERHVTRGPDILHRTQLGENSIQKRGQEVWNKIPEETKSISSFIFFKKKLKAFFLENSE